jgi:hypothetical protein
MENENENKETKVVENEKTEKPKRKRLYTYRNRKQAPADEVPEKTQELETQNKRHDKIITKDESITKDPVFDPKVSKDLAIDSKDSETDPLIKKIVNTDKFLKIGSYLLGGVLLYFTLFPRDSLKKTMTQPKLQPPTPQNSPKSLKSLNLPLSKTVEKSEIESSAISTNNMRCFIPLPVGF